MSCTMLQKDRSLHTGTITVRADIAIRRPVAEVWAFAADFEHDPHWRSEVQSMRHITPSPIGVGTQTVEVSRVLWQQLETTTEITEYEPHRKIAARSVAALTPVAVYRSFEAVPDGTRLTYGLEGDVRKVALFRLLRPLLERWYQGQIQRYLRTLRHILEGKAHVEAAAGQQGETR